MSSFIATAVTQKAVLIPVFILPSVMLLILFVTKNFFSFKYQFEEEAGSAEEQPASNKADAYTIVKGAEQLAPFSLLSVSRMAKKTY